MRRIVVDATPITPQPSGVGLYVANLIDCLWQLQRSQNFELGIVYQPSFKNWLRRNLAFPESLQKYSESYLLPFPVRVTNFLLQNLPQAFPLLLEKYTNYPDIIHGTNFSVFPYQKSLKVITLYDLTFLRYPEYVDQVVATYAPRVQQCLQWTDLVITISESTKEDAINYLQISPEKIHVTPLASRYSPDYLSLEQQEQLKQSCSYDFSRPYLLFVSTIEPRKNINALITAFNYLKGKHKIDHDLVLIGKKGWRYEPIFQAIAESPYQQNIHHLDYLSDDLVALFYTLAEVFVYPSHYEGFGLPVLEAMNLGTPVIASSSSSLPEVIGDAGLLINPDEPMELAEAILQVISNSQLQQDLIVKGRQRATNFSWEKTAQETLIAYSKIIP
ncbi:glycosyltransferase [Xenococcus sp. PCC 7305]|uniref:glycosyltransferase family 4 protein n=1 Tax=Xenococcus sp. PCC 7305 TaxID=102125 RepID=UPI0002AC1875|nr:glycosyltransferase family 1 protein [Xenococcus sp. PCC 7305]ELS03126.1 glycosyltransferase [Xenococcus sp. PCC 7305]